MTIEQAIALFERIYAMRDKLVYVYRGNPVQEISLTYRKEGDLSDIVVLIDDLVIECEEAWEAYKQEYGIVEEGTISFAPGDRVEIAATGIIDSVSGSGCVVRVHGVLVPMVGTAMRKVEQEGS